MQPRILIAEDDEAQAALLQAAMEGQGYRADIVNNGLEALRKLRSGGYDLALLDYNLPDVDGLAAAQLIQDMPTDTRRPQLVAITASAERLSERQSLVGHSSFDAVVSKRHGLPALMTVVDDQLKIAWQLQESERAAREREAMFQRASTRRRRMMAPMAAIPALAMTSIFALGLSATASSFYATKNASTAARQTIALQGNANALADIMQKAELKQQAYMLTGNEAYKEAFYAEAEQLDRMLTSQESFRIDGRPGSGMLSAQAITTPWLREMTTPMDQRPQLTAAELTAGPATEPSEHLTKFRHWANYLTTGSQDLVMSSLDLVRNNLQFVMGVLSLGMAFGCWSAFRSVQRRWREPQGPVTMQASAMSFELISNDRPHSS